MKASEVYSALEHFTAQKIPVFIWGAPGIGKSSIVKKIAKEKGLEFIDLRLSLLDPTDLKGIPFFDSERREGVWAKPAFLPKDRDSKGILFLDEINTAAPSVQASAYQLVLDRRVGEYELPDGWSIVAAGNRENDRGVVYRMPPPLANRFVHLEMEVDFDDWKSWAYESGVDPLIIAFLSYAPKRLFMFDPKKADKSFPTPRSWEYVDKILKSSIPENLLLESISGAVGRESAVEFLSFRQIAKKLPDLKKILDGEIKECKQKDHKVLFAVVLGLVNLLKIDGDRKRVDNVLNFSMNLPSEFAVMLVKDMQKNGIDIESSSVWDRWVAKFSYLLE